MRMRFALVAASLAMATAVLAQGPRAPRETITATVNGKKVAIEYGRPALKGRSLDDLIKQLPEDRIWRAGVDQVTTFTTETDLMIGDKKVPAGKYSLYVHAPATGDWSLVLNTDPGIALIKIFPQAPPAVAQALWPRLDGYQKNVADKEVVRAPMKSGAPKEAVEIFTLTFSPAPFGASLNMAWGNRTWSIDIKAAK